MYNIEEEIQKRLDAFRADIVSGAITSNDDLEKSIAHSKNALLSGAVLKGNIDKLKASSIIEEKYIVSAKQLYKEHKRQTLSISPLIETKKNEIQDLIDRDEIDKAKEVMNNIMELLNDEEAVKAGLQENTFFADDVEYFQNDVYPQLLQEINKKIPEEKKGFARLGAGLKYIFLGTNPYNNQKTKIKSEKVEVPSEDRTLLGNIIAWSKKHKVATTIAGAAAAASLMAGGSFVSHWVTGNWNAAIDQPVETDEAGLSDENEDSIEMASFEVDEFHNFNINDEQTHIEKLQLLAHRFMEHGIPVVSEDECMKKTNAKQVAVSPEQLSNWLISANLADIDDLTFTKLMENSNTTKEELTADFNRVNNLLGAIYTTKVETPFLYEFISNKEDSNYIKAYEEAIIENQKGNKEDLKNLINSRIDTPVTGAYSGALGMTTSALAYCQLNVYNVNVIGQDAMNAYNINNDCKTDTTTTFYSDDWDGYTKIVDEKLVASLTYMNSDRNAYDEYLASLSDEQDDNKVFIEATVLPYLEKENVQFGPWVLIEEIAGERSINYSGVGNDSRVKGTTQVSSGSGKVTTKTVVKAPETAAEKEVQKKVEAVFAKKNQQSFENVVLDYAKQNDTTVTKNAEGDFILKKEGEEDIVVDGDTMGTYDPNKDYQGPTFKDYNEYKDAHSEYVQYIEGLGDVVVPVETTEASNKNVQTDGKGNYYYKPTGDKVITGSGTEIDDYINSHPDILEGTITEEGEIHYSDVDDEPEQDKSSTTKPDTSDQNQSTNPSTPNWGDQPSINEDIYNTLTPEQKEEFEDIINAGKDPVPGEIVDDSFSDTVYGNYTVTQLLNNLALCQNIPESVLQEYPEIWNAYQNWLEQKRLEEKRKMEQAQLEEQQRIEAEQQEIDQAQTYYEVTEPSYQAEPEFDEEPSPDFTEPEPDIIFESDIVEVPVQETITENSDAIATQISALEEAKADLLGDGITIEEGKTLS